MDIRIGNGYDVHALKEGLRMWLGGIKIDSENRGEGLSHFEDMGSKLWLLESDGDIGIPDLVALFMNNSDNFSK